MYSTILVPTDGSAGSNEALRHGVDIAKKYDATLHLVYVVDEDIYGHYGGIDAIEHVMEALEDAGEEALQTARKLVTEAGIPVEVHLEHTTPHRGIIETASQVGADLIVMGTEQRSKEYRHLLGSVSERVVRLSSVPVHLVKVGPDKSGISIREATAVDDDAIRRIARRSMNQSYSSFLAETEIDKAIDRWYGTETFEDLVSDPNTIFLTAVKNETIVGFSQSHLVDTPAGMTGEIHWLHVDPDHRENGIGTSLLNNTRAILEDHDVDRINGLVLSDYEAGNVFYEENGLIYVESRPIEIGGEPFEENVYSDVSPAGEDREPQIESYTTADGETLYLNYEESEIGRDGPFFAAYTTRELGDRYGWFCSNCGSVDVAMDTMGRIVCNQCGNRHKATRWDAVVTE